MRAKVAVATVQGKAYFLIVNELKQRSIPFVSLIPGESVRVEIRGVITTAHSSSEGAFVTVTFRTLKERSRNY